MCLLAGLMALGQAANAQVRTIPGGVGGGGTGPGGPTRGGPARSFMMVLNEQDVGASLLKVCDANQDGTANADEVTGALWNWFRKADADSNGALSEVELATALKTLFPVPEPPPGAPPMPEEHALHNQLAKKLMATADSNNDTWIVFKEALAFVSQNVSSWDANSSSSLDASEFAAAFRLFLPGPPSAGARGGAGPRY